MVVQASLTAVPEEQDVRNEHVHRDERVGQLSHGGRCVSGFARVLCVSSSLRVEGLGAAASLFPVDATFAHRQTNAALPLLRCLARSSRERCDTTCASL